MNNLLIIAHNFWPENFPINNLVNELSKKKLNIIILTGKPNYPLGKIYKNYKYFLPEKEIFKNYKSTIIYRVPIIPRGNGSFYSKILNYLTFIISAIFFGTFFLKNKKIDHINVFAPSPVIHCFVGIYFKFLKKVKLSIWLQDLWPHTLELAGKKASAFLFYPLKILINFIYLRTDYIFVQSKMYYKVLKQFKSKLIYLPNSINLVEKKIIKKKKLELKRKKFNICYFGNLGLVQEFDTILDTCKKFKLNNEIEFHFFGAGLKKKYIKNYIYQNELKNVFTHNHLSEFFLRLIIKNASVLFLSLKKNKFLNLTAPSKLQLYLYSGKPIIAEISGECRRIIFESKAGFCVKHEDRNNLFRKINYLYNLRHSKKINSFGINGKKFYKENFSINKITNKFLLSIK